MAASAPVETTSQTTAQHTTTSMTSAPPSASRESESSGGAAGISNQVSAHYNARDDNGWQHRQQSPIIHVKNINNWIKAAFFTMYCPRGAVGLDLCCGKGGDLNKWTNAGASYLVAADIAHRSVEHLIARYRSSGKGRRPSYGLLPLSGDLCHVDLSAYLPPALFFDFVSCQFAFHYSFESHERARRLMANAAGRLKPGGYFVGTVPDDAVLMSKLRAAPGMEFGNDLYRVAFQTPHKGPFTDSFGIRYLFTLRDAVESCPEYLVPLPALRQLGEEAGLELLHCENLHEFFYRHASSPALYPVLARMRTIPFRHPVPADQWDAVYIYRIFIFRKRDGPLPPSPAATTWPPTPPEPIVMTS